MVLRGLQAFALRSKTSSLGHLHCKGPDTGVKPSGHTHDGLPLAGKHLNVQLWWPGAHGLLSDMKSESKSDSIQNA